MKTYTPELSPSVLGRLAEYADSFASESPQARPAQWAGVYLQGLLIGGERKSIEPLSRRVNLPGDLAVEDPDQAPQRFVNQSPRDHEPVLRRYRSVLAETFASPQGAFPFDGVSFPKQGKCSAGVQRQYCGALGRKANCQVAVGAHYVTPKGHYPLDLRLHLPDARLSDGGRLDKAGVPDGQRRPLTKGQIALELLDGVRAGGLPGRAVVADAGHGVSKDLRDGLEARRLARAAGVTEDLVVFTREPRREVPGPSGGGAGRPRTRPRLAGGDAPPVALGELARQAMLRRVTRREGAEGGLSGRFAWLRVWPGHGWRRGDCAGEGPVWLLIEEQADGQIKYAFSNLPEGTGVKKAVRLWKSRRPVEQGHQQMKEELGLGHFGVRSWRGSHHHCCLVMLAFGFLLLERLRAEEAEGKGPALGGPGKEGVNGRR
jgi:SRSO17 transposase